MNVLFVCSRNQWRSSTAEEIFNLIFVMEKKHKQILLTRFPDIRHEKQLIALNIPDNYQFMDENLVEILKTLVAPYLNQSDNH